VATACADAQVQQAQAEAGGDSAGAAAEVWSALARAFEAFLLGVDALQARMPPAACMLINRSRACWYVCLVHWQVCVPHSTALQSMPAACGAHTAPRHMASSAVERPLLPVRAMAAPVTQTQRPRQHQPARNSRGNDRRLPCQWRRPRLAGNTSLEKCTTCGYRAKPHLERVR